MPSAASLAPNFDVEVHIVLDDFGKSGRAYRETAEEDTTLGSVVAGGHGFRQCFETADIYPRLPSRTA